MRIVFISNFINHHQVHVADELYNTPDVDYTFIATVSLPESFAKSGYPDYSSRPYLLKAYESPEMYQKALALAFNSDVVIIGSAPEEFVTKRIQANKLTFRYSERWFKAKPWYMSGPRAWCNFYLNHIRYYKKPLYMLAASAYTANDVYAIGAYKNKIFKWGYFTKVSNDDTINTINLKEANEGAISMMWCARFINWKHPELPVMLAKRLKDQGYNFHIDMYGSGDEFDTIRTLINKLGVADVVQLCGNLPNDQILQQMQNHHIFLFTSDKNEGWGAVLNEAMSNGCVAVASNKIGAVPFLIQDGENGLIFQSEDINSLEEKVKLLMKDKILRSKMSTNAYCTIKDIWSPRNAVNQLLKLIDALQNNKQDEIASFVGPCSRTYPYK